MNRPLFQGELVYLTAIDPEKDAEAQAQWHRDTGYLRMLDSDPPRPLSADKAKEMLGKIEASPTSFPFAIRTLDGDRLIGNIGLEDILWNHGDCWVWIGIGDRAYWGKGYGTDAMRVILRYAFEELNLHRVSLDYFEYNTRAGASYRKVGFVEEGRARGFLHRDGRRWDMIYMGVLRAEWERLKPG